ncbi:MAG: DegT/DnrJ/EryC1/StrS family aminotransferase [Prevotella sp.]|nr:DegT/DnrJ/EryC1/StrS family aminotransferase [Prevotella sp.]MBO4893264.1 DegT/DnrJ/EryC1/StrS family aminotransferase [Prevotella sp.]MBR5987931.1 DegT/DnrJ/EryC1/StrS family aminotransferase [Prevotella sp.]
MMIIPFSPPDITEQEILEVADALRSGWITTGPRTKALEKEVAALCHTDKAVCLGSATACLESVLRLLGIGPGDEVITTAYTYTASASVVCHVGATLRLVDTQKDSLEMDYDQLAATINERTKAVIPVDIAGIPCDYDQVLAVVDAKRHLFRPANDLQKAIGRVAVTADAAHALGASRGGKMTGAMADFSSFSFHATKNLTTAEGGALTWRPLTGIDDEWIYKQFQLLSLHGQSKDALEKTQKGGWEYDIVSPAYKCNMTDLAAAVGLAQIRRYPAMLEKRRRLIETYDAALKGEDVQVLRHYTDAYTSSGHLYMVRLNGRSLEARNEVIERMAQQGVATNVHYKPLPMMTAYRRLGFDIADYPHAYALFQNEITLPLYSRLNDEQVAYLLKTFKETIR